MVLVSGGPSCANEASAPNKPAAPADDNDALLHIVEKCFGPNVAEDCRRCSWPPGDNACPGDWPCRSTIEVWAEDGEYVAIRDRKMCDCPAEFVHGLAIPRTPVTGVEDARRPDGIWAFAWTAARKRIRDDSTIALVVSSKKLRTQNQLHIHLVRLRKHAREDFAQHTTARVQQLNEVWATAARQAGAAGLDDYGVLVASDLRGGFVVLVVDEADRKGSTARRYTEEHCLAVQ